jgi:hypothetical protein
MRSKGGGAAGKVVLDTLGEIASERRNAVGVDGA